MEGHKYLLSGWMNSHVLLKSNFISTSLLDFMQDTKIFNTLSFPYNVYNQNFYMSFYHNVAFADRLV